MIVIGDIHGKVDRYLKLLARHRNEPSVQLGDFGIGFPGDEPLPPLPGNAWFIRGNHDNPEAARSHSNYLGDYGSRTIDGIRIFFLSGALVVRSVASDRRRELVGRRGAARGRAAGCFRSL